jgi:hypothetical protein
MALGRAASRTSVRNDSVLHSFVVAIVYGAAGRGRTREEGKERRESPLLSSLHSLVTMAALHAQLLGPFRRTYNYCVCTTPAPALEPVPLTQFHLQQKAAHEHPAIFYSVIIGAVGTHIIPPRPSSLPANGAEETTRGDFQRGKEGELTCISRRRSRRRPGRAVGKEELLWMGPDRAPSYELPWCVARSSETG